MRWIRKERTRKASRKRGLVEALREWSCQTTGHQTFRATAERILNCSADPKSASPPPSFPSPAWLQAWWRGRFSTTASQTSSCEKETETTTRKQAAAPAMLVLYASWLKTECQVIPEALLFGVSEVGGSRPGKQAFFKPISRVDTLFYPLYGRPRFIGQNPIFRTPASCVNVITSQ